MTKRKMRQNERQEEKRLMEAVCAEKGPSASYEPSSFEEAFQELEEYYLMTQSTERFEALVH